MEQIITPETEHQVINRSRVRGSFGSLLTAVLYQDNHSAARLMENGTSNAERTRHIAIRFFWLKDRINSRELTVVYCPTADMVADLLTKPLQGEQFRRLRRLLLNWEQ